MKHFIFDQEITSKTVLNQQLATFAMGCFWGAEKLFWSLEGVLMTSVGYTGSDFGTVETPPTYQQVCSGRTGHAEALQVIFDPELISYHELLKAFWENHDPTQGMRQGNDIGSEYRSAIYYHSEEQKQLAQQSKSTYQTALLNNSSIKQRITTEIKPIGNYYLAEEYHQQYLAKNPGGYCGIGGTGVCYQ